MINREEIEKQVRKDLENDYIDLQELRKVDTKIDRTKDVIKDIKITIAHSHGISKVLLKWHLEHLEKNLMRCEILREITRQKYLEQN